MANAYFGDHPGRLEIPGECLNPVSHETLLVSKFIENQECGATLTSQRVANATGAAAGRKTAAAKCPGQDVKLQPQSVPRKGRVVMRKALI